MNNQKSVGEQMLQLQNIAYMKQFMQKASVKLLFIVTLLLAVANSLFIYSFKDIYDFVLRFLLSIGITTINPDDFDHMSNLIDMGFTTSIITTAVINLILPLSLLYIIIRSRSENPSIIPVGMIKFLHVISFIQTIFVVASAVITFISEFIAIFGADDTFSAIISFIAVAVILFFSCLYYILQTKFLKAIKTSSTGYSLVYGTSNGFAILSVLAAIGNGVFAACSLVVTIVFYSLFESSSVETNESFNHFVTIGGLEFIETIKPMVILFIAITILNTLYHTFVASTAFTYKNFIKLAVRESFTAHKVPNLNTNSAFRTYGGSNSFTNYNYTNSGARGQQSYAAASNNTNNTKEDTNGNTNTDNTNVISEAPIESNFNSYNNNQQGIDNNPQYNEPIIGNGSFIPAPQQEKSINNEPVITNGSFGIPHDPNNYH